MSLKEHNMFTKLEHDYVMGLAFGFPECCIKNFVNMDKLGIRDIARWMEKHFGQDDLKYHYVRCVQCRRMK